jgi:hypothetical protein
MVSGGHSSWKQAASRTITRNQVPRYSNKGTGAMFSFCKSYYCMSTIRPLSFSATRGEVITACGLTMWDVGVKRISTNEQVRRLHGCRLTHNSMDDDSLMETRRCRWLSKLSAVMKQSRSPRRMLLGAWCRLQRHDQ